MQSSAAKRSGTGGVTKSSMRYPQLLRPRSLRSVALAVAFGLMFGIFLIKLASGAPIWTPALIVPAAASAMQ